MIYNTFICRNVSSDEESEKDTNNEDIKNIAEPLILTEKSDVSSSKKKVGPLKEEIIGEIIKIRNNVKQISDESKLIQIYEILKHCSNLLSSKTNSLNCERTKPEVITIIIE